MTALALLLALSQATSADATLAKNARAILEKSCSGCHGGESPRAGLDVLDWKALRGAQVVPKQPERSELLWLVDAGNMPPGERPRLSDADRKTLREWVEKGAMDIPRPPVFAWGDEYVLKQVMRDWSTLKGGEKAHVRYLSLDHLLSLPDGAERLALARKELERVLPALASPDATGFKLTPIDTQQSVFRIDLASLGWDRRPFVIPPPDEKQKPSPSRLTVFDLILLEYPYAVVSFTPPFVEAVPFLVATESVRPVAYVRGDWLLGLLGNKKFAREVALLAGKPEDAALPAPVAKEVWGAPLTLAMMRGEVGWKGEQGRFEEALKGEKVNPARETPREDWQSRFPGVVQRLGLGTALLPWDGVEAPSLTPDPAFTVKAETILYEPNRDPKTMKVVGKAKRIGQARVFKIGQALGLSVTPSKDATVELALHDHDLTTEQMLKPTEVPGAKEYSFDNRGRGFEVTPPASEDHWIVFAFAGKSGLPGTTHHAKDFKGKVRDRFIHPFYRLSDGGKDWDRPIPTAAKVTVEFKTVKE
jgi:hypothetical protein